MQSQLSEAYPSLVQAMGTERMESALFQAFHQTLPGDELFGFERSFLNRHRRLVSAGRAALAVDRTGASHQRFHRFDPITEVIVSRDGESSRLLQLRAEEIGHAGYRFHCYEKPRYSERITFASRHERGWYVLNFYRHQGRAAATAASIGRLRELAELAVPLIAKHVALCQGDGSTADPVVRIEQRLAVRFPVLASREREVCARTMLGHSGKSIAQTLGIAATTVLTHRRRAYEKLNISSASQLTGSILS